MQLLGSKKGKSAREVEPHLVAEDRARADAGAVAFLDSFVQHAFHQIKVLAHRLLRSVVCG